MDEVPEIPEGDYTLAAVYKCEQDGSAAVGSRGPAWTGTVRSAAVPIRIRTHKSAPSGRPEPAPENPKVF